MKCKAHRLIIVNNKNGEVLQEWGEVKNCIISELTGEKKLIVSVEVKEGEK